MTSGIVYVVTGSDEYYRECERSIESLRRHKYLGPIHVFAENPEKLPPTGLVEVSAVARGDLSSRGLSRHLKTSLAAITPFDLTLFLDTDTTLQSVLAPLESYLGGGEIGLALDIYPTLRSVMRQHLLSSAHPLEELLLTREKHPPDTAQYNAGVVLFRRSREVSRLFTAWNKEWRLFGHNDQLALMRALATNPVALTVLPPALNSHKPTIRGGTPVIFHYWAYRTFNKMHFVGRLGFRVIHFGRTLARKLVPGLFRRRIMKRVPEPIKNSKYYEEFV